jgi:hypothetical protein
MSARRYVYSQAPADTACRFVHSVAAASAEIVSFVATFTHMKKSNTQFLSSASVKDTILAFACMLVFGFLLVAMIGLMIVFL